MESRSPFDGVIRGAGGELEFELSEGRKELLVAAGGTDMLGIEILGGIEGGGCACVSSCCCADFCCVFA